MALQNLSICYSWKNIRKQYNNNKFKTIAPTWNDEFESPDGSCSVSGIQYYTEFEFIMKNHEKLTTIPSIHVYINRINYRLEFIIKDGFKLELKTSKTMKLFCSTKKLRKSDKTKNREKVPILEVVEVVLVQCNLVDNQFQQKREALYTFTSNKSYNYLLKC